MHTRRPAGKVLVLGEDTRSFLTVIRSLGRRGLEVHTAWAPPSSPALASRYVRAHHDIPAPTSSSTAWLAPFCSLARAEQYDLILPCDDPRTLPLQQHRSQLAGLPVHLLDDDVFRIVSDKHASTDLARRYGVHVPRSTLVTDPDRAPEILKTLDPPIVLKPLSSFTTSNLTSRHSVQTAYSASEASLLLDRMLRQGPVLAQEHVRGVGTGIEVLANNGRTLVAFQHMRVHEPLRGGGSSYRTSVPLHPELLAASVKLVDALRYTGVAMFEYKLDPTSGRWAFMEINGRFWGSLPLAVACGADFPAFLYDMLVHGREHFPRRFRHGLFARNLTQDVDWFRQNLRADRTDPTLQALPWGTVLAELRHVAHLRERNDTFVQDDPRPGFLELAALVRHTASRAREKAHFKLLSLPTLRRRARARILRALGRATSIAFVCAGNICRSPFAAGYARKVFGDRLRILSLGLRDADGHSSPEAAVSVARGLGVDLSSHRSHAVTAHELHGVDVIFVFDALNHARLIQRFPLLRRRVFLLAQLDLSLPLVIDDPWAQTVRHVEQAFASIRQAIDAAAMALNIPSEHDDPSAAPDARPSSVLTLR